MPRKNHQSPRVIELGLVLVALLIGGKAGISQLSSSQPDRSLSKEVTITNAKQSASSLLSIKFNINKYPENYVILNNNKAGFSQAQLTNATNRNKGKAWFTDQALDNTSRSGQGQALITQKVVEDTSKMVRPAFGYSVKPSGYTFNNRIVQLPNYRGYFYNKSHTIAWSLVGALGGRSSSSNKAMQVENVTTGTRAQNVGTNNRSSSGAGGMAYGETLIRNYAWSHPNTSIYYVVTPIYYGNELVPRGSHVQAESTQDDGKSFNLNLWVFNNQAGANVNYATGTFSISK